MHLRKALKLHIAIMHEEILYYTFAHLTLKH